ncbi:MAG: BACON domain-containing protein [Candidatus Cyclobacteriaceae bacterium M2_1C_046]
MQKIILSILLLFSLGYLISCGNDDPDIIATSIELNPSTVFLNEGQTSNILLTTKPGGIASWSISSKPSWLEVSPESGSTNGEGTALTLTPINDNMEPGDYNGTLEIISSAGSTSASITFTVDAHPKVQLSSNELNFDAATESQTITLTNSGTGALNWEALSDVTWMTINPATGSVSTSETTDIVVTVDRNNLPQGTETGSITFTSNADHGDMIVSVNMDVPEIATISLSTDTLGYDYFINEKEITVTNEGNVSYDFTLSSSNGLVEFSPATGSLEVGASTVVLMTTNRASLNTGLFSDMIIASNPKEEADTLQVGIKNFLEEKWLISDVIKDAEYDRNNDVLIAVVGNELRKYDPVNQTHTSVTLNLLANCVSVGLDGSHAVVGHNGYLSYVDLTTMTLLNTLPVTADVFDIVLAPNGYAYAFPEEDQWEQIRCINLSDGTETLHSGGSSIYENTRAKLHPSGTVIYGADNNLSPSDFEKYDISGGTAQYLYDSPYHGDYSFNGNIWISDNGNFLFSRGMDVFRSTTDKTTDMTYAGSLGDNQYVVALDHSSLANQVYAILTTGSKFDNIPASEINAYDGSYFQFQKTIPLPKFIIPDGVGGGELFNSQGMFGYFNSDATKYFVVVRNAGDLNSYAIVNITVE